MMMTLLYLDCNFLASRICLQVRSTFSEFALFKKMYGFGTHVPSQYRNSLSYESLRKDLSMAKLSAAAFSPGRVKNV